MEYQKVANLLDSASNKPSKFRTRNWVEINDDIRGVYSSNKQIRFKTTMLGSMTQYNSLNVKPSNSQLNKLKSAIKNKSEVVLRLSSNMIGDDEIKFPRKLLTNRQVPNLRKALAIIYQLILSYQKLSYLR